MTQFFLSLALVLSALLCPWWVTVFLGVLSLAFFRAYMLVVFAGLLMDILFGSPEPRLLGFSYIYTLVFLLLASITWFLNRTILD